MFYSHSLMLVLQMRQKSDQNQTRTYSNLMICSPYCRFLIYWPAYDYKSCGLRIIILFFAFILNFIYLHKAHVDTLLLFLKFFITLIIIFKQLNTIFYRTTQMKSQKVSLFYYQFIFLFIFHY